MYFCNMFMKRKLLIVLTKKFKIFLPVLILVFVIASLTGSSVKQSGDMNNKLPVFKYSKLHKSNTSSVIFSSFINSNTKLKTTNPYFNIVKFTSPINQKNKFNFIFPQYEQQITFSHLNHLRAPPQFHN